MTARDKRAVLATAMSLIGGAMLLIDVYTGWRIPPEFRPKK